MKALWLLVPALLATAACQQKPEIRVSDGWVRLSAVRDNPSAAYFTLHGGEKDATLVSVTSPVAIRTEMHESMTKGTMSTMAPVRTVALPAGGTVEFKPGGKHVMLYYVNPGVKPGWTMDLRYTFSNGLILIQRAKVVGPGDPAP
jgi:periplasmic copper chaperone A